MGDPPWRDVCDTKPLPRDPDPLVVALQMQGYCMVYMVTLQLKDLMV